MGLLVANGAQLMCSFGMAPSVLVVPPQNKVISGTPSANVMDMKPMVNIMPFGMCTSMANPTVAAATAAALGVLTPQPCIPVITGPWAPGSATVLIANMPALNNTCKAMCAYGGVIQILSPGQTNVMVGN
ncbi:hypothetical protein CE91St46_16710 [Eubacteriales bacterium]|nr:DUF4280 domain-containing protein [Faecalicatena sp. BF-R-105]GKH50560.1 hypothetical protein CE91St46_16710 [Eubacteriales bacterium]GKH63282.1 hypothetical protein CE91St47_17510 [Eubacteriales bacterium]